LSPAKRAGVIEIEKIKKNMMKSNAIAELLLKSQGFDISKYDEIFMEKLLRKRIAETCCGTEDDYYSLLQQNEDEGARFLDSLLISYSEFFRNPLTFAVLERVILPAIMLKKANTKRKEIRIWSSACAAGQETYSLAMLLKEFRNGEGAGINFRIFATDYCEAELDLARKGQYSAKALNNVNLRRVNQWFTKQGNTYTVKHEMKENIDYSVFDLLSEEFSAPPSSIFGDFDLVVCANMLFYYKPEYRKKILEKLTHALAGGGFLITGETEREILLHNNFEEVYPQSAIFRI